MPINNFIIATEPMSEEEVRYINRDDICAHDNKFHVHYFRISQDNRLFVWRRRELHKKLPKGFEIICKKSNA